MHVESVLNEVLGQTLQEISSDEMEKERLRVEEEKRKLEEARLVTAFGTKRSTNNSVKCILLCFTEGSRSMKPS